MDKAEDGYFLSAADAKRAVEKHSKEANVDRAGLFEHATKPHARLQHTNCVERFKQWFDKQMQESAVPSNEQPVVLKTVRDRLLTEVELDAVGPGCCMAGKHKRKREDAREEPTRSLIHGFPGTGKSRAIKWAIRMFEGVMCWQHGKEFVCVAFQNKVASAINGSTLHSAGEIKIGQQNCSAMHGCRVVDSLFIKNDCLRWVLFDEICMIPDGLLGIFGKSFQEAAPRSQSNRYFQRPNGEYSIHGGSLSISMLVIIMSPYFS